MIEKVEDMKNPPKSTCFSIAVINPLGLGDTNESHHYCVYGDNYSDDLAT